MRTVKSGRGRRFRGAPSFEDQDIHGIEELRHLFAERRSAGDREYQLAAEDALHFFEEECVGQAMKNIYVPGKRLPSILRCPAFFPTLRAQEKIAFLMGEAERTPCMILA